MRVGKMREMSLYHLFSNLEKVLFLSPFLLMGCFFEILNALLQTQLFIGGDVFLHRVNFKSKYRRERLNLENSVSFKKLVE